ncbi:octanoyltransferase [Lottiidibacillus patelloidae]|uniref:Octanoyl-[GcvH]:protein N-octanoyltransferase n=1 Tax=Lottiidibacillus patelloidae TaxID=2670334 RepID=A0A263BU72_9BACI|nr:lipoate--protein ligase family protein [Lottiidibacillus patelloidae]OZM56726.1 octanoyltransferase [Lottiidibacillus patelloidae]
MSNNETLLTQKKWRYIDQTTLGEAFGALRSFAIDDTLCAQVGSKKSDPCIRSWVHHKTVVLGIADTRLPYLQEGINFLEGHGYNVIVRNSGGLAVVLDEGVLNISLVVPDTEQGIDIDRGYDAMFQLIKESLKQYNLTIEAREIMGSYCPGSYDLSVGGKKFAGISQRRLRNGVAVQIYLCITGSGSERAKLIQQFYTLATKGEKTKTVFPKVEPSTMASLSEIIGNEKHVHEMILFLLQAMQFHTEEIVQNQLSTDELELYYENYDRVVKRNEKALEK